MERWKFIKDNNCWYIEISDIEQLNEYRKATDYRFEKALCDTSENALETNKYLQLARIYAQKSGNSLADGMIELSEKMYKTQVDNLLNYGVLYLNESGGYNTIVNPIKHLYKDKLVFPNYTKEDIRIPQWGQEAKGNHYYAYIGKIQVMDRDVIKWDTYKEAYEQALKYV